MKCGLSGTVSLAEDSSFQQILLFPVYWHSGSDGDVVEQWMELGQEEEFGATQGNTVSLLAVLPYCWIYGYKIEKLDLLVYVGSESIYEQGR